MFANHKFWPAGTGAHHRHFCSNWDFGDLVMLSVGPHTRIYLFPGNTDMRKSFDGLRAAVERSTVSLTPQCGHIFGFANRRRNMTKFLYWDGTGFWVCAKKLQKGTFWWPKIIADQPTQEISSEQLSALLGGLNLPQQERQNWLRVKPGSEQVAAWVKSPINIFAF